MSLTGLLDVVLADPSLARVVETSSGALDLTAPHGMRPFVVAALAARAGRTVLAVTATGREAEDLVAALGSLHDPDRVALYPDLGDAAARAAEPARRHRRAPAGGAAPARATRRPTTRPPARSTSSSRPSAACCSRR